jgi:hypothetical protein
MVTKFVTSKGVTTSVQLPWDASDSSFATETTGGPWGAIDSLAPPEADVSWTSGDADRYLGTSMRVVELPGKTIGVVVDQRGGFETIVHAHVVMVVRNNRLLEVKRWVGAGGPFWSAVAVINGEVIHHELYFSPDDTADTSTVSTFGWKSKSATLEPVTRKTRLSVLSAATFPSAALARKSLQSATETGLDGTSCTQNMVVLASKSYAGIEGTAFIGAVSTSDAFAQARVKQIGRCTSRWKDLKVVSVP